MKIPIKKGPGVQIKDKPAAPESGHPFNKLNPTTCPLNKWPKLTK